MPPKDEAEDKMNEMLPNTSEHPKPPSGVRKPGFPRSVLEMWDLRSIYVITVRRYCQTITENAI